ncbi:hypothetical protein GCM10023093_22540 [Nemorincola caseinilytica]|uniref:NodB homology domain-containing protein n=1 Tax=Nemorincola caseinilytica TaxID=2054315 RepID=A0ABP8NKR6_9BACT
MVGSIYLCKRLLTKPDKNEFHVPEKNMFVFPGLMGPSSPSVLPERQMASWGKYHVDNRSALAVLLTDTLSHWIGIAHGLKGIGVPFTITTDVAEAVKHKVVLVYPLISGKVLNREQLQAIAAIPRNGGTLIATNVYGGGLNAVFGYEEIAESNNRSRLKLQMNDKIPQFNDIFSDVIDAEIIVAGTAKEDAIATMGYTKAETPLVAYDDGTACMTYRDYGSGKAYALGLDIGNYFRRNMNGRGFDPNRAYVNNYEAGVDILLRMLKEIYTTGNPDAVTIWPVPFNRPFSMMMTHDVDYTKSIVNAATYAAMEKQFRIKATYFIQTKYIKDWNDDIFFNENNIKYLQQIHRAGMEIASHSVAHSKVFSKFPMGTGNESYPDYRPFVFDREHTYNGSILGELRVSKFLLERNTDSGIVRSFRPGHLQYPFGISQALMATGYRNSSSITAGNAQTALPFMLTYNRDLETETDIVEFPVAVEDELGLPMLERVDSTFLLAKKLSKYGGALNILIHTDICGQKMEYEKRVLTQLRDTAWTTTIGEYGNWWRQRNKIKVSVDRVAGQPVVSIDNGGEKVQGITIHVPAGWQLHDNAGNVHQTANAIVIDELSSPMILNFREKR